MSAPYTGNSANPVPTSITLPSDGDKVTAASVNPAFEGLADGLAHLNEEGAVHPLRVGDTATMQAATAADGDQWLLVEAGLPAHGPYVVGLYVWQADADPAFAASPQRYDGASTVPGAPDLGAWVLMQRPLETIAYGFKTSLVNTTISSIGAFEDILEDAGPDVPLSVTFGNLIDGDVVEVEGQCSYITGDRHGQFVITYDDGGGDTSPAEGRVERLSPGGAVEQSSVRWSLTFAISGSVTTLTIRLQAVIDNTFGGSGDITVSSSTIRAKVLRP